jgi:hypothetical protein
VSLYPFGEGGGELFGLWILLLTLAAVVIGLIVGLLTIPRCSALLAAAARDRCRMDRRRVLDSAPKAPSNRGVD